MEQVSNVDVLRLTETSDDQRLLKVDLASKDGSIKTLCLDPETARLFASVLSEFVEQAEQSARVRNPIPMTKIPRSFAVGRARYERLVLVRFEDDAPYALNPSEALELGEALAVEAEALADEDFASLQ